MKAYKDKNINVINIYNDFSKYPYLKASIMKFLKDNLVTETIDLNEYNYSLEKILAKLVKYLDKNNENKKIMLQLVHIIREYQR